MPTLLKPQSGTATTEIVADACALVGIDLDESATEWTQAQRDRVYDYAIRLHLRASDNHTVRRAPKPRFLRLR